MNADDLVQYVIVQEDNRFVLKRIDRACQIGRMIAGHPTKIEAIRVVIPQTHVRANAPVAAPILEVWIDKRVAGQ